MILYHSSNTIVKRPDVSFSRDYLDFGNGFYLTSLREQAQKYGNRFIRREQNAWLNVYEFDFDPSEWRMRKFEHYSLEWLEFVTKCRMGDDDTDYDIIIGGVADDKVIRTLDMFFNGDITAEAALGKLKYEKLNNQYCIRSQKMINECLKYIESIKL